MPDDETPVLDPFTEEVTVNLRCDIIEPATMQGYERDPRSVAKRAEDFLKDSTVETVVARAIAKVGKIYKLIRDCSTWNRLVLFKGPSWDSEWKDFQKKSPYKDELVIKNTHEYSVGDILYVILFNSGKRFAEGADVVQGELV